MKLPEVINEEEFLKILDVTKKPKYKLAFGLGFYEGLRVAEVACLKPEHVNMKMKLLMIKASDVSKGIKGAKRGKDRNIPIAPEIIRGLRYLPVGNSNAKGMGIRGIQLAFKKAAAKALNRPELHFHTLRHSCATHYLTKKKWNAFEVQRLLGHSKVAITEIYAHVNPENLVDRMWEDNKN